MHRHAKSSASAGVGLIAFAVSLLGIPRWLALSLLALGAFLLIASALFWIGEARPRPDGLVVSKKLTEERQAVESLKSLANEHTRADIIFFPPHQFRMAETIAALFERSGWGANFTKVPQESGGGHSRYVEGVEVQGRNSQLVMRVADALRTAGFSMVEPAIQDQPEIGHGHPKYDRSMGRIEVRVGHTRETGEWS